MHRVALDGKQGSKWRGQGPTVRLVEGPPQNYFFASDVNHFGIKNWSHPFLVGGLEPWNFMTFHSVGNVIIPTDEVHHFSEG